jgi:DNA polymerase-3 subunit gamma/tau
MTENSNYLELYKRYTPKSWSGLIGQERVAKSLRSAVASQKLPTAYAFLGPRGCGKTSAAKLLAKAVNCTNPPAPGDPCNECDNCVSITNNTQIGVEYLSMADGGGKVDATRALMERSRLIQSIPQTVFILDEVHNLSAQAWDSLLIPLESPDSNALFILCSTEAHKIPETILSRVQQRSFRLIDPATMGKYLTKISEREGLDIDEDGIAAAVRLGRGSARDSLTALERIVQTGEVEASYGNRLLEALQTLKLSSILSVVAEFANSGEKFKYFAEQLYGDLRDILLLASGASEDIVPVSPVSDPRAFVASLGGINGTMYMLEVIGKSISNMGINGGQHRITFELALFQGVKKSKSLVTSR